MFLIAGPCVIESEDLVMDVAGRMVEITSHLGLEYIFKSSFGCADNFVLRSNIQGAHFCREAGGVAVGQHRHPVLTSRVIGVHSVLHNKFNHVGAGALLQIVGGDKLIIPFC